MEKIYVLLPVHNRRETTRKFIECLASQTYRNFHLVLIDDGSLDGTTEMVLSILPSSTVLRGKGNWWWAGSLQQGYQWLKRNRVSLCDLVLIINDDTVCESDFLQKAIELLKQRKRTLLLAQCFSKQTGRLLDAGVHVDWNKFVFRQASGVSEINCLSTRGLFMRTQDFFEIGGFYPSILPHYTSDYEFTIRAYRKGFQLFTDSNLMLWVDQSTTGLHKFETDSLPKFLKQYFSIKSAVNPLVWLAFIGLACPWAYKLKNWQLIFRRMKDEIKPRINSAIRRRLRIFKFWNILM